MSRPVTVVDAERAFTLPELFFSTTDKAGVIRYGNEVFTRISGFARDELIGKPHNVIRHPDMPAAVFSLLWEFLEAGKPIAAYVKNRAADGTYYWVVALAAPIEGGYLSIRLKPSTPTFDLVRGVYTQMRQRERDAIEAGLTKQQAIQKSREFLGQTLASVGFASYDDFMHHALVAEVRSRQTLLAKTSGTIAAPTIDEDDCQRASGLLAAEIGAAFAKLGVLDELKAALADQAKFVRDLGARLQRLSLNAQIRAAGLAEDGATLQVVAQQMSHNARTVSQSTQDVCSEMTAVTTVLTTAASRIAMADLSVETMRVFLREREEGDGAERKVRIAQLAEIVERNVNNATEACVTSADRLRNLDRRLDDFVKAIRTLEILHVTGKVESIRCQSGEAVSTIFREVEADTVTARQRLGTLSELLERARIEPPDSRKIQKSLAPLRAA